MSLFHFLKSFAQFIAITFSLFTNIVLITLVIHKSPKKLGNYKYLMCYFCVMSMIYAGLDYVVQPVCLGYGT
uniref:G_PROTEIN_RECEP_F1_2 domain-containing protein n=1 Tax=Caenorhabditis tropicalis TaxID=1561998 RepID=A0A1I7TC74_9PELO